MKVSAPLLEPEAGADDIHLGFLTLWGSWWEPPLLRLLAPPPTATVASSKAPRNPPFADAVAILELEAGPSLTGLNELRPPPLSCHFTQCSCTQPDIHAYPDTRKSHLVEAASERRPCTQEELPPGRNSRLSDWFLPLRDACLEARRGVLTHVMHPPA